MIREWVGKGARRYAGVVAVLAFTVAAVGIAVGAGPVTTEHANVRVLASIERQRPPASGAAASAGGIPMPPATRAGAIPGTQAVPTWTAAMRQGGTARVLFLGDSITAGSTWPSEFCRLASVAAGVMCDIRNAAVAGTDCGYWVSRIAELKASFHPDLVFLACGTNNDARTIAGRELLGWQFRSIVEAVHPTPIVPVLIQYSDPLLAPQWVLDSERPANDTLWINMQYYLPAGWFPGVVSWQTIPATATYLTADPTPQYPNGVGLHSTDRGQHYQGRLAYDAVAPGYGWPPATEPPLCDLYGHSKDYPRPTYTPC